MQAKKINLIIATGSNLNDRFKNLNMACEKLTKYFSLIQKSSIYESKAVDFENQPDFLNQVLEFEIPPQSPREVLKTCLEIEKSMGRHRDIPKGPRIIDIDIIFFSDIELKDKSLFIPHPSWKDRAFVVKPLIEMGHSKIQETYLETLQFQTHAGKY